MTLVPWIYPHTDMSVSLCEVYQYLQICLSYDPHKERWNIGINPRVMYLKHATVHYYTILRWSFITIAIAKQEFSSFQEKQWSFTREILMPELWILCITLPLIVLYLSSFIPIVSVEQQLSSGQESVTGKVTGKYARGITPKLLKPDLWILCKTLALLKLYP